jgi:archaemetzincin
MKRVFSACGWRPLTLLGSGLVCWLWADPVASGPSPFKVPPFKVPDEAARLLAVGLDVAPAASGALRALLEPGPEDLPIEAPGPADWLTHFREADETFEAYLEAGFARPDRERRRIYLRPIGSYPGDAVVPLEDLRAYAQAFFQLETRLLPALDPAALKIPERRHPQTGQRQLRAQELAMALRRDLPVDAFCALGITLIDLYPDESWSYVFGLALPERRVGVFSLARYDPTFWGQPLDEAGRHLFFRRALGVLAHEALHLFWMRHCTFFRCIGNGVNHLAEADSRPRHLCPVCLRKLQHNIGFDPERQHRELRAFYARRGLVEEAAWLTERLLRVPSCSHGSE